MNALNKLHELSQALTLLGIEYADKEAELIIRQGLGLTLLDLYRDNPELTEEQAMLIDNIVNRRSGREPLQYILGHTDFLGLKIMVGPGVLIPRPETELMAEYAIKILRTKSPEYREQAKNKGQQSKILDLCAGSGCLALALARDLPDTRVYAVDISDTALSYARKNAELNKISNIEFACGHLFGAVRDEALFDFIISNPPYIKSGDINTLQSEIKDREPLNALDGGSDGLDFYRRIIPGARKRLKDNGILMLELGDGCADAVAGLLEQENYRQIKTTKDYAGIKRIISAGK